MTLAESLPDQQKCQSCGIKRHTTRDLIIRRKEWNWPVTIKICDICLDGTLTYLFENLPIQWAEGFMKDLGVR